MENAKKRYKSSKYKTKLVLELLGGTAIELISRRENLPVSELSDWKNSFIKGGSEGFSNRNNPLAKELQVARSLIADQAMELALHKKKAELVRKMHGK